MNIIDLEHDEISLTIGWPPSVNNYYAKTRYGIYIKAKGKQYRESVAVDIRVQLGSIVSINEPIFLSAILYPPDNRTRDLDNYMKAMLDALTKAGLWEDDKLVDQLHLYRGEKCKGGQVKLYLKPAMPIAPIWMTPGGIT